MREFTSIDVLLLIQAAQWTLALAAIALVGGTIGGLAIALMRTAHSPWLYRPAQAFIIVFQGTPLLMQLFLIFFGAPVLGLNINPWIAAGLALVLNTSAFLGDIWRGCIQAIPKGQTEASLALNLSSFHRIKDVILPQAFKVAVPPTVGFMVQIIKGTSLTAIIGFTELTRTGQIINNATFEPVLVFSLVALLYFCMCWPLSRLADHMERRLARSVR